MYGKPLNPKKTSFIIDIEDDQISMFLTDLEEPTNDDVREVDHPLWEILFGNAMENVFEPWDQTFIDKEFNNKPENKDKKPLKALSTKEEVENFLISIGMTKG